MELDWDVVVPPKRFIEKFPIIESGYYDLHHGEHKTCWKFSLFQGRMPPAGNSSMKGLGDALRAPRIPCFWNSRQMDIFLQ
jgi:hypothetical protein